MYWQFRIKLPCVSITPLGLPVEPEVYCKTASDSELKFGRFPVIGLVEIDLIGCDPFKRLEFRCIVREFGDPLNMVVDRDGDFCLGISRYRFDASHVSVATRRESRHSNDACVETAKDGAYKVESRGEQQQGPLARHSHLNQSLGDGSGTPVQFAVCIDQLFLFTVDQIRVSNTIRPFGGELAQSLDEIYGNWRRRR